MDRSPFGPGVSPSTAVKIGALVVLGLLATVTGIRATHLSQNKRLAEDFVREAFRLEDASSLYVSGDWTLQGIGIDPDEAAVFNGLAASARLADLFCRPDLGGTVTCRLTTISQDSLGPIVTEVHFRFNSGLIRSIEIPSAPTPIDL